MSDHNPPIAQQFDDALKGFAHGGRRPRAERHTAVTPLLVAPYDGELFPRESQFRRALCVNVSESGLAMLLIVRPEWQEAVIGLPTSADMKYLRAAVVRRYPIEFRGRRHFFVGFRFVAEMQPPKHFLHPPIV